MYELDNYFTQHHAWPEIAQKTGLPVTTLIALYVHRLSNTAEPIEHSIRRATAFLGVSQEDAGEAYAAFEAAGLLKKGVPVSVDGVAKVMGLRNKSGKTRIEYTPDFLEVWEIYPERGGANPKKAAFSAYNARLKEGHTPEQIAAGIKRYKLYCERLGIVGTQYVMRLQTFLGPERYFLQPFNVADKRRQQANDRVFNARAGVVDYTEGLKRTPFTKGE